MFDWNDLRYFLAVAQTGSTLAAGHALRMSQTTVARRIAALEQAIGLPVFERRQSGYRLTGAGEALLVHAAAVETATGRFLESAASQRRDASGTVRLTMQEIHAVTVLGPMLRDLRSAHPAITVELDTSETVRDLAAGEADIALRSARRPKGAGLVCRRVADEPWTVYCSRGYADAHGGPPDVSMLRAHPFVGGGSEGVWRIYRNWLKQHDLEGSVAIHHDSVTGVMSAVRSSMGLAILPCFVADQEKDLIRCMTPAPEIERGLWLLTHERMRHVPRIRVVMDFLAERMTGLAQQQKSAIG